MPRAGAPSAGSSSVSGGTGTGGSGAGGGGTSHAGSGGRGGDMAEGGAPEPELTVEERCRELDDALGVPRPAGWEVASHCKEAPPDYDEVFGAEIARLEIKIAPQDFDAMQLDLDQLMNEGPPEEEDPGEGGCDLGDCPDPGGGEPDACTEAGRACTVGWLGTKGTCVQAGKLITCQGPLDVVPSPPTPLDAAAPFWRREPKYFDATLSYGGKTWTHVGYRYKGNNGLASADPNKRPFRLEFDELETQHPETTDQRFFGFKELSFAPGGGTDPSYVRQVATSEMLARADVPIARSALVSVYLDRGNGPEPLGVYSMTEVPGDPLTKRLFDDKNGCLYKPDGLGAHLLAHHPESFHPKGDGCPADQADAKALISALNASATDRPAWRKQLESALDVAGVVRFFAANQANGNWDTYGGLAHNYYLYADRDGGAFRFIPWDFDLSLGATIEADFSLDGFGGEWPLLQAIARDAELYAAYHEDLAEIAAREYDGGLLSKRVAELAAQVRPLLAAEHADVEAFDGAIAELQEGLKGAQRGLDDYLASRGY